MTALSLGTIARPKKKFRTFLRERFGGWRFNFNTRERRHPWDHSEICADSSWPVRAQVVSDTSRRFQRPRTVMVRVSTD